MSAEIERHTPIQYEIFGWGCTCPYDWVGPNFAAWRLHFAACLRAEEAGHIQEHLHDRLQRGPAKTQETNPDLWRSA